VAGTKVFATTDGGATWADITGPDSGSGALPAQDLKGVALVPVDNSDFSVQLRNGKSFEVSLRGAQTLTDVKNFIEFQSRETPTSAARVTVTLMEGATDRKITLTDVLGGGGTFTVTALN